MTDIYAQLPRATPTIEEDLKTFYLSSIHPVLKITEELARLDQITVVGDEIQIALKQSMGYLRRNTSVSVPRARLDELLDLYETQSTYLLHNKSCTLLRLDGKIHGIQMPPVNDKRRRTQCVEILLENYDGLKPVEKVEGKIGEITDEKENNNHATGSKARKLIINWTPAHESYVGPRQPIELVREMRVRWTQNFSRPFYRSGIFTEPFNVLLQDNKIAGMQYGTPQIKQQRASANQITNEPFAENVLDAQQKGPLVTWQKRTWEVAPYYVKDLTKAIHGEPKAQLTAMLKYTKDARTIVDGNREILIFDDKCPIKSMTILMGRIHDVTLNTKIDARAWEQQSIEAIVYRNKAKA